MSKVTVQFLGTGDAFGSGGRFQSCIRIELSNQSYMLDFGASSLIAMKRCNVDPSHVYAILLTHLHGDHFGGIPFFLIQEQLVSKRTSPILIAGPPGLEERINLAMEVFFPGSSKMQWKFPIEFFQISGPTQIGKLTVIPFPVVHASGSPSYAFRIECAERSSAIRETANGLMHWLMPRRGRISLFVKPISSRKKRSIISIIELYGNTVQS